MRAWQRTGCVGRSLPRRATCGQTERDVKLRRKKHTRALNRDTSTTPQLAHVYASTVNPSRCLLVLLVTGPATAAG